MYSSGHSSGVFIEVICFQNYWQSSLFWMLSKVKLQGVLQRLRENKWLREGSFQIGSRPSDPVIVQLPRVKPTFSGSNMVIAVLLARYQQYYLITLTNSVSLTIYWQRHTMIQKSFLLNTMYIMKTCFLIIIYPGSKQISIGKLSHSDDYHANISGP